MGKQIEFYFDFGSPYSYLAQSQLKKLAAGTGHSIIFMPTSVIDLMKAVGNSPTSIECKPKKQYVKADLQRWVKRYGIGWEFNPHFRHIDLSFLLRAAIAAIKLGVIADFVPKVFDGLYRQSLNLGDATILKDFLRNNDLPGDQIVELMNTEETFEELKARNASALEKGLFGLPTFRVGDEIFFGNDRLPFVEASANAQA
ncbi:2-hydroxychromene-2-carboxylate isomerase [Bradyrhizobium sp. Ai1a-2]|uniref:2-hydroxychromene-2-carboxylate isomerase n=1 Tax=Bradyrhizobium sp. Ai1a-2 TaxID=196490 RepID=UPI00040883E9|nr:2-hydroxychromene-2-carboxylate isomerase [Bradyrhizobium sp. Ai1a-2]